MSSHIPPKPMTDPLAEGDGQDAAHQPQQAQRWGHFGQQQAPEPPPEPIAEEPNIQRGMPVQSMTKWLTMLILAGVVGYMLLPDSATAPAKKEDPVPPAIRTNIADSLKSEAPPIVAPPPAPILPQPTMVEANDTSDEDARLALIISSPMEATQVVLNSGDQGQRRQQRSDSPDQTQGSLDAAQRHMQQQQELILKAMGTTNSAEKSEQFPGGASGGGASNRASDRHAAFLAQSESAKIHPAEVLTAAIPEGTLYQGSIVRLVLDGMLRSDLPGMIRGRVVSDVYDSIHMRDLLIPRGSTFDCRYQSAILVGQSRMLVACERLRLPNGKSVRMAGNPVSDMEGASGIPADVNTHFWSRFSSTLIMGAASLLLPAEDRTISEETNPAGGTRRAGTILGTALNSVITQTLDRNSSIGPTGSVDAGMPFTLVTTRDLQLERYTGRAGR